MPQVQISTGILSRTAFFACAFLVSSLNAQAPAGIATVAGNGVGGYSDGNKIAANASLDLAYNIAVDPWGNVYIADTWNHRVRKVMPDGTILPFAGSGVEGFSGDKGQAVAAALSYPRGLAADARGNIYICDSGNSVIRKVQPDGVIVTVAGNRAVGTQGDGGLATLASFRVPRGIAVDAIGNLYVADSFNARIRRIGADGKITPYAGTGQFGNSGDGGPATKADIGFAHSLAFDTKGALYFTDTYTHSVRKIGANGIIETVAGVGQAGFAGDGTSARGAMLNLPRGIVVDQQGNVFVVDSGNQRIRRIGAEGGITTVAGTGTAGFGGDAGPAAAAAFNYPYGLASDARGNLFIADLLNYRIRKARFELLQNTPSLAQTAVTNGASFGPQVSSGSLISIFGKDFTYLESSALELPLAPSLAGTSLLINGKPAPMVFASPGQINAQLPWGLTSPVRVKVNFGGLESSEVSVPLLVASPGIFAYADSRGVVQNQDSTLNTPANAAPRGSTVIIYATGLGVVSPAQGDGVGAPVTPLARTSAVTNVSFANVTATAAFSGLTPGFVGLWQINVVVPANAPIGAAVPVKLSVSGQESTAVMIAVK